MKTNYLLYFFIILIYGCGSDRYNGKPLVLNDTDELNLTLDNAVVFDTSANLLNIKLVKYPEETVIKNASISLIQEGDTIKGFTNKEGEFEIFKNNFFGSWDIQIKHPELKSIEIENFKIGGGKWITIGIKE